MSKERARNRAAREREAGIKAAAKGAEKDRHERRQAAKKPAARTQARKAAKKPAKQSHPRTPDKKRNHAPVGRPDGPLARRRRFRVRLLLALLVAVNVGAWLIWPDWSARLAVLIVSVISAPLLAALLLRRR